MFTIQENDSLLKKQFALYDAILAGEVTAEVAAEANNTIGKVIGLQRNQLLLLELTQGLKGYDRDRTPKIAKPQSANHRS